MTPSVAPLAGCTVAVTRSAARSGALTDRLVGLGACVVAVPVIAIGPPADDGHALRHAISELQSDDLLVVTSAHGAEAVSAAGCWPDVTIAAVGSATSVALRSLGFEASIVPSSQTASALADVVGPAFGSGRALFAAAEAASDDLEHGLAAHGWTVQRVEAYRTVLVMPDKTAVAAALRAEFVTFTSGSTVRGWCEAIGDVSTSPPGVSIGPSTSAEARSAGVDLVAEADPHDLDGLCAAVVGAFRQRS